MLIIGNGPSLNKTPLADFENVPAIGLNKINLIFERTSWRPSLVLSSNPLVVSQNTEFWASTDIPIFLSWKNHWFLPRAVKDRVNFYLQINSKAFQTDIVRGIGAGATITFAAMQFAYYMGANPLILFGVDHSFALKTTDKKGDIVKSQEDDKSHFDPNYFGKGTWWQLPDLDYSERAYALARTAFESEGRQILDATLGGQLEVFPKITLREARELCGCEA